MAGECHARGMDRWTLGTRMDALTGERIVDDDGDDLLVSVQCRMTHDEDTTRTRRGVAGIDNGGNDQQRPRRNAMQWTRCGCAEMPVSRSENVSHLVSASNAYPSGQL